MEDVVKEGRTVLFVSHQIAAINQLCQKIIWLDNGNIVDYGDANTVIPKYLSVGLSDNPVISFQEPRDKTGIFFSKLSILDHKFNPSTQLDARFPFSINLHYEVESPLTGVEMAMRIKTTDGSSVFTAVYSDYSDVLKMDKVPGSYVASVQVPAHFLVPGTYTISPAAFQFKADYHPLQALENVIRFTICETGTKVGKYTDHKSIGVVLVNFPWKDEALTKRP
jgi:lipopolysaccharide transport system ATP-binding protein